MSTTFAGITITLLRDDGGNNAQWLAPPRLDERDLLGVAETDVNLLGYGSPELSCRVLVDGQSNFNAFMLQNGREGTLDSGDGEGARTCVLSVGSIDARNGYRYILQCRFKETG